MTTSREPKDIRAQREQNPGGGAETPHWELMYKALWMQLTAYVDAAVAEARVGHGPSTGTAAPSDPRLAGTRRPATSAFESAPLPPWLQPFALPDKVRFTRTPDVFLRSERASPAISEPERESAEHPSAGPDFPSLDLTVPARQKPVILPANVRFNRTPSRRPEGGPVSAETSHEPAPMVPGTRSTSPGEPALAQDDRDGSREPADPVWFGIIRAARSGAPRHADEQDNGMIVIDALEPMEGPESDARLAEAWLAGHGGFAAGLARADLEPACLADFAPDPEHALPAIESGDGGAALSALAGLSSLEADVPIGMDEEAQFWSDRFETEPPASEAAHSALWPEAGPEPEPAGATIKPTGIASPDDARAFVGPARNPSGRRPPNPPKSATPFEGASRTEIDPELWEEPGLHLLVEPPEPTGEVLSSGALEQNARLLEGVLEEFGVRGEIIDVRPGPVVTLYEFEPAPGTKSSRVIGLSDDVARSMSAVSARVAVVQGRNVIGIELPNQRRETVFLRDMLSVEDFSGSKHKLAIALGKTIGGEPIVVDLARMPHLLVAGTTGSGKSVAINTMILSLLYRLRPDQCRLIMIDPKMLELSIYEGIPHLLTPVVTDPKKAVVALKWAVREMEDRYKKMSKVGVRNIDGFNVRVAEAAEKGETITRTVQTGFNRDTGEPIFETEAMELSTLPYIVVIVDEMADLMMVAGKDIEGAIQRLAQMARAAGIHLIMATQRPSVDVITGTIKANFPTRISFQVTSKIDSRTILGEQGAEQLLGQGDMLYMAGGGRIGRVHGPFVSDGEVEKVVAHLKTQGHPAYLDVVVAEEDAAPEAGKAAEPTDDKAVFDRGALGEDDRDLYDQAVKVVLRDKKCSTSYIQRRLQVGYNKAASLVERMEKEGIVGQANNAGKREILVYSRDLRFGEGRDGEE